MTIEKPMVADVMTTRPRVVAVHASLEEADVVLRSTLITGLPVIDGDGALVGVVTHADLVGYRFSHRTSSGESTGQAPTAGSESQARPDR